MPENKRVLIDTIYETLLQRIMQGTFTAGESISENKIASEFSVSRTPVRTALIQLEQDGLVELIPNRSPRVMCYSSDAMQDIGTVRLILDNLAVKLAILYGSRADFLELEKFANDCKYGIQTGDEHLWHSADSNFHLLLSKISKNRLLVQFQNDLYLRVNFILLTHNDAIKNLPMHIQEHFELIQAMMQHDELRAQQIITHHLVTFYNLKEKYPENFFPCHF